MATATPSPAAKAKKKKNKKKKKKKANAAADSNANADTPDNGRMTSKSAADLVIVRDILKKFDMDYLDEVAVHNAVTSTQSSSKSTFMARGFLTGPQRMERQFLLSLAHDNFRKLATFVGVDASALPKPGFEVKSET